MPPLHRLLQRHLPLPLVRGQIHFHPWPPAADVFLRRGLASSSSAAAAAAAGREKSSRRTLGYLLGVAAAMVGASYAAVPLYRRFCQATGYGGTVQRRESVEEKISRHARDGTTPSREIIIQFNADVADGMPWKFIPTQREVKVKPGESALAFYTAENRSSAPITGVSTYNVAPMKQFTLTKYNVSALRSKHYFQGSRLTCRYSSTLILSLRQTPKWTG
ncbi:unnamed protein product [Alopecurus aequalis]